MVQELDLASRVAFVRDPEPVETIRKPLAKVEGRRRIRLSGLPIAWRGTPSPDDWVTDIVGTNLKKFILAAREGLGHRARAAPACR
jgi:hypothetical protein